MDGQRFDKLTRRLATGASRRAVIKGLAGGLVGGLVALRGGGVDAARKPNGATCSRLTECASLRCADGVCCDTTCTGQCEACDLAGTEGACTPLPAGAQQHGNRPACTGTDVCQAACDGVQRDYCTHYPGLDIPCKPTECDHGWQISYGCGGDGTCHPLVEPCEPYVCGGDGDGCLTTCATDADCVSEAHCAGGACIGDRPPGSPCTGPGQCTTGICANNVCCVETCGGACEACGSDGFCGPAPDETGCGVDDLCCDGDCVDVATDVANCGGCDNACPGVLNGQPICAGGDCGIACDEGFIDEEGACVPEIECESPSDCADLGSNLCEVAACIEGRCALVPADGETICRAAAHACDATEFCTEQSTTCPPDLDADDNTLCDNGSCCGGVCLPTQTDPSNCGTCGTVCPDVENGAPICVSGDCTIDCDPGYVLNGQGQCEPVPTCDGPEDCLQPANPCKLAVCAGDTCIEVDNENNSQCGDSGFCCDGNCCAEGQLCGGGFCVTPDLCAGVTCTPSDCQTNGICNPSTGLCEFTTVPNNEECGPLGAGFFCCLGSCCGDGALSCDPVSGCSGTP